MASFVAMREAQEKLPELLDRAEGGEEIVIERDGRAAAKLVAIVPEKPNAGKRVFGQNLLRITYIAPDFDEPMSEEELKEWMPARRTLAERIAMLPEDSTATWMRTSPRMSRQVGSTETSSRFALCASLRPSAERLGLRPGFFWHG